MASTPSPIAPLHNSVKALRCRRNMTQEQLARRTGVARQTIINVEQRRTVPSIFLAYRIAAVLDVPVREIFSMS
jgi:putative transcriptional regulator